MSTKRQITAACAILCIILLLTYFLWPEQPTEDALTERGGLIALIKLADSAQAVLLLHPDKPTITLDDDIFQKLKRAARVERLKFDFRHGEWVVFAEVQLLRNEDEIGSFTYYDESVISYNGTYLWLKHDPLTSLRPPQRRVAPSPESN